MYTRRHSDDQEDTTPLPPPPELGPKLFFTSAKTSEGVNEIFTYIAARTIRRMNWLDAVEAEVRSQDADATGPTNHDRALNLRHFDMSKLQGRCCT
jgi:Ras-related protein Rab-7A